MDKGFVEHFDEPAMNLCLYGFLFLMKVEQEVQIVEILLFLGTINVVRTVLRTVQLKIETNFPPISKAVTPRLLLNH